MKYDDLEKTQELFEIPEDVPTPIENIEMEGISKNNVTDEFTLGLRDDEVKEVKKEIKPKKDKKTFKEKWNNLSKKKKIGIIIGLILLLALIIGLILFFVLKEDKQDSGYTNNDDKPNVVIEKDNYIYRDGSLTLLNTLEQEIGTYECVNKDEELCYVASFSDEDNFDTTRMIYDDETKLERVSNIYDDKYVFIFDNDSKNDDKIILYNIEDKKTEGSYSLVKGFKDSNFVVLKDTDGKYGALELNKDGITEKIKFSHEYLGIINKDSKVISKEKNKYFVLSRDGKKESKAISYEVKSYNDKYIITNNNGYYVYDYSGSLIFDNPYDFISLSDEYMGLVKESKLYIRDFDNQAYNEDGFELGNEYYNITNIYDKKKKLIATKMAYKIEKVEDTLEVTYYNKNNKEKTKNLSIYEGKLSGKYAYVNYFDGTFYFYKDEVKTELVGKYSCSNKNIIDKDTTNFSNCYIASDSFYSKNDAEVDNSANLGWIPIINERYVFMVDSIDPSNPTISLYDLTDNKVKGRYTSVDTGSYTKAENGSVKTSDSMYIMAENKDKEYGVIKIEDTAKSAIAFKYASVEKVKDCFLVKESNGTYQLLDKKGDAVTDKFAYKIMNYQDEYLSVLDNNSYYLYDFNGNKVDYTSYLYIDLKTDFYVTINDNKQLDIRKYNDYSFSLSNPIDIDSDNYKNAYEVTKTKDGFNIKIKDSGATIKVDEFGRIA